MGAHGSCCSCEDENSSSYIDGDGKKKGGIRKRTPGEFVIVIDRRTGEGLGIDASPEKDGTLEIRSITPGGLVERWNQAHDSRQHAAVQVHPGMRIIEVNGRYNSAMQLIAACRECEVLHMTVRPD
mmetsp:Transcript_4471/g.8101  ORF Transcript_4471/g.8101 Transcript_4471/m.8101 type:complete len:126 (-) Transcript_4471:66-443(-)